MSSRLAAGGTFTCALTDAGRVVCWGGNDFGQLGYGNTNNIGDDETPNDNPVGLGFVPLPGGLAAVSVTVGSAHACALLSSGQVTCWGHGFRGKLGYGNTNDIGDNETPAQNPVNGGIVPLPGGQTATAIAAGSNHTCALLISGQVTCWGIGNNGRLGYGNTNDIGDDETPAQNPINGGIVPLPGGQTATTITTGSDFTCALLSSRKVSCWGNNLNGSLGYGNTDSIGHTAGNTPATNPVNGGIVPLPGDADVLAVAAGEQHSCAILATGGLTCWGDGTNGKLGYGNTNDIGDNELPSANPVGGGLVSLPGGQTPIAIAVGNSQTCAVLANGGLTCWGGGVSGVLGYGNTNDIGDNELPSANPVNGGIVPLTGGQRVAAVSAGFAHTCALFTIGQVTCFGNGSVGRLGYGNTNAIGDNELPSANPVAGGAVPLPAGQPAVDVDGGAFFTCALLASGQVSCWGTNAVGQLGLGAAATIGDDEVPAEGFRGSIVPLPLDLTAVAISMSTHACAVLSNGGVTCWGSGALGKLGYGNTNDIGDNETPATNPVNGGIVPLPGGAGAVDVAVGSAHTCALLATGRVTCWGSSAAGQLGYGNLTTIGDNETPAGNPVNGGLVALPGDLRAVAVAAGDLHTCAILTSGRVTCWGEAANGRLGYGNTNDIGDNETPATNPVNGGLVPLPGNQRAIAISAGNAHTCAVLATLQITCWGAGNEGRLGYGNTNDIGDNETPNNNPVNGGIVAMPGAQLAISVSVGSQHTCAVLNSNNVTCWGIGAVGVLGYGNTNSIGDNETPATNPVSGGIVQLPDGLPVAALGTGGGQTCAVLSSRTVTCWGGGSVGTIGYGNTNNIGDNETPATNPVSGGIVQLPNPLQPNDLVPLTPARLVDTRPGFVTVDGQQQGGGTRAAGSTLTVNVAGRGGVPRNATAAVFSVSAVTPSADGFVTVYPCDQTRPTAASLNYQTGVTVANTALAKLSRTGTVCVFTNQPTHLVVDVNAATPPSSALTAVNPARLADTRPGSTTIDGGNVGGGPLAAGGTLVLPVSGRGGVPAAARGVALNVAAVSPAANGFLTIYPCDQGLPTTSSLNYRAGVNTANFAYVSTAANGSVCIFSNQATHVVVDVVAHHRTDRPVPTRHHPVPPSRMVDTRPGFTTLDGRFQAQGERAAGSTLVLDVSHRFPAANTRLASFNVTAVTPTANGFITVYPCDQARPTAATFNYRAGITRSVGTLATVSPQGTVCIFTNQATHLVVDINGTTL